MKQPKLYFKDEKEANELLEEWKHMLFLDEWNIKLYFSDHLDNDNCGLSNVQWVNSCGTITLLTRRTLTNYENTIEKVCHEKVLIHELLHFKYMAVENDTLIENVYYSEKQHQLLEQMAKSLYMAKYNISYEWFKR